MQRECSVQNVAFAFGQRPQLRRLGTRKCDAWVQRAGCILCIWTLARLVTQVECLFRAPGEQAASQANTAVLTSTEGMGGFSLPGAVRRFARAQIGLVSQVELVLWLGRVMEIRFLETIGVVGEGKVDIDDGNFYCFTCWLVYHAARERLLQDATHVPPARNLQGVASAPESAQHERGVGDVSLTFGRRPQLQRPQAAHAVKPSSLKSEVGILVRTPTPVTALWRRVTRATALWRGVRRERC
jgi:hypothetical protein